MMRGKRAALQGAPIRRLRGCLVGLVASLGAGLLSGCVISASELCTGDPCIIPAGTFDIGPLVDLDFGNVDVILNGKLNLGPDNSVNITARSFTIAPGGQITGNGTNSAEAGSALDITVSDFIQINGTATGGAIMLNGCSAGSIDLEAPNGSITGTGRIQMSKIFGCTLSGDGGTLTIRKGVLPGTPLGSPAFGPAQVNLGGPIDAVGGSQALGGTVDISAEGDVSLGPLDLNGGEGDGGTLSIVTGGAITLRSVDASSAGIVGFGGTLDISSGGPIQLLGPIRALGGNGSLDGDDGGSLSLLAGSPGNLADIHMADVIQLDGRGQFGAGGSLLVDGANVTIDQPIQVRGAGLDGPAGSVDIFASGNMIVGGAIDLKRGGGGQITLTANGDLDIRAPIDGGASQGTSGGVVDLQAGQSLIDRATLSAAGSGTGQSGGNIFLDGCDVQVAPGVLLDASLDGGTIDVRAGQQMTLAGNFTAGPAFGAITLGHRLASKPPDLTGATFNLTPAVAVDPTIPPCAVCTGAGDADLDGVDDSCDSCTMVANPTQTDTDADGFGNACDCDFDQDGLCGIADFNLFLPDFQSGLDSGIGSDMDASGGVGITDFNLFLDGFGAGAPGPSAMNP